MSNPKSRPPARIECLNLQIQDYNFGIVYKQEVYNPSDFLSRRALTDSSDKTKTLRAENYLNFLAQYAVPKSMDILEMQQATLADKTLQALVSIVRNNSRKIFRTMQMEGVDTRELKSYAKLRHELTVNDDESLLLRGSRIIIPKSSRCRAIEIVHEGHQGIVKTLFQAIGPENLPAPLRMNDLPPQPWHTLHMDHCGPFPTGKYFLAVIDSYSRFPEVDSVHSTSASTTIAKLDRIFAIHGLPHIVKTVNEPPFNSSDFANYMKKNGIQFNLITPLRLQANSEAENFNKPLEKAIKAARIEGKDWKKELY